MNEPKTISGDEPVDVPDMGIVLKYHQVSALLELFAQPGWKVLQEIWTAEMKGAVDGGMALNQSEETRALHRGAYHTLCDIMCLEGNIRYAHDFALGLVKEA